jgi:hypothetical protein
MLHVTSVRPTGSYRLWLQFSDGAEGEVDLGPELDGPVFEPLRAPEMFAQVAIDPEVRTIAWPNGADFAPEFLHSLVRKHATA